MIEQAVHAWDVMNWVAGAAPLRAFGIGNKVFKTVIPRNVRISESPSHGLPIILYDVKSVLPAAAVDGRL